MNVRVLEIAHAWFRRWFALGVPAFEVVIAIYYLMIVKPLAVAGN